MDKSTQNQGRMARVEKEIVRVEFSNGPVEPRFRDNVLIVVDVQNDFMSDGILSVHQSESLIEPLNEAIRSAEKHGIDVVFTQDWHPENHKSFNTNGGAWVPHCLAGSPGAELHPGLYRPPQSTVVRFGTDATKDGYSPLESDEFLRCIASKNRVVVTGLALEYCVLATCIEIAKLGKTAIVVDPLVRAADPDMIGEIWEEYKANAVIIARDVPWPS